MDPSQVNWLAVFVAALFGPGLGALFYGPKQKPKSFALSLVLALVGSANLAFFLGPTATLGFGAFAGFAAGIGWVATGMAMSGSFRARPARETLVDAGYHVVLLTLMGILLGAWRKH